MTGRTAVIRWARRLFRREWRQQLLVLSLLTVAVAAAVGSITLVHNSAAADNAEFGSASYQLKFDARDPHKLAAALAAAKRWFGTTQVVRHSYATVPGGVDRVYYLGLDPHGPYLGDVLSLRRGTYPAGPGQVAVTDGVAKLMRLRIGSTLALDGQRRTLVGIVENSRKLSDEFALVTPSSLQAPHYVTVLVDASADSVDSFVNSVNAPFLGAERPSNNQATATLAMFSVATVFLFLAALVAAAGFAVIAQRRLRQLGIFAAIGATPKHLRLVLMSNGAFVGATAALLGTVAGVVLWLVAAPMLETAVDHRIDRLGLPWLLIGLTALLAIGAAMTAAWWPARTAARLPVVLALSGRPPKPRPARRAAIAAVVLIAVGIGLLVLSHRHKGLFIVAGIATTILGMVLLGPPALQLFSRLAGRVSVAPRLALRDLARYQARSGAALAAVTVALGIAATVVLVASAEAAKRNSQPPNLTERQIRVHLGPSENREGVPVDVLSRQATLAANVRRLAAQLDHTTVIPLRMTVERLSNTWVDQFSGTQMFATVDLTTTKDQKSFEHAAWLFVATPTLLKYLGIDPATVRPSTDFLVYPGVPIRELVMPSSSSRRVFGLTHVQRIEPRTRLFGSFNFGFNEVRRYTPPAFITLDGLRRHGWKQVPSGWVVESRRPLTSDQIARARSIAANGGFTIEVRRHKTTFEKTLAIATAAGALLALAILAMTVGLIRSESAGDLRTLTATGATSGIRRTLTATTAGALALFGAVLGVTGAYLALIALYRDDLDYLRSVPVLYLALAVVGVPLAAAAAGWLISGREPPTLARPAIE